jgi:hypothetical protein
VRSSLSCANGTPGNDHVRKDRLMVYTTDRRGVVSTTPILTTTNDRSVQSWLTHTLRRESRQGKSRASRCRCSLKRRDGAQSAPDTCRSKRSTEQPGARMGCTLIAESATHRRTSGSTRPAPGHLRSAISNGPMACLPRSSLQWSLRKGTGARSATETWGRECLVTSTTATPRDGLEGSSAHAVMALSVWPVTAQSACGPWPTTSSAIRRNPRRDNRIYHA